MQGVQVDLPLPLRKTAADSRPLRLQVKRPPASSSEFS